VIPIERLQTAKLASTDYPSKAGAVRSVIPRPSTGDRAFDAKTQKLAANYEMELDRLDMVMQEVSSVNFSSILYPALPAGYSLGFSSTGSDFREAASVSGWSGRCPARERASSRVSMPSGRSSPGLPGPWRRPTGGESCSA